MPYAPTPCLEVTCRNHAVNAGRCAEHQRPKQYRTYRQLDLPKDWNTRRTIVLRRDKSICYLCGGTATQVDHVTPGNNHHPNNLKAICTTCHQKKTSQEALEAKRGSRAKRRL